MIHRGCGGWEDWPVRQEYPVIEGTLIRLAVTQPAPGYAALEPMWLWASDPGAGRDQDAVATLWQAYLRRFDLEHVFRFLKSQLGWDKPMLRNPQAADRWTWLIIACYAQLYLAPRTRRGYPAALAAAPGRHRHSAGHDPRPGPRRIPRRPPDRRHARQRRETGQARPRPARGFGNKHKEPRHPVGKTTPKPHTIAGQKRNQAKRSSKTASPTG